MSAYSGTPAQMTVLSDTLKFGGMFWRDIDIFAYYMTCAQFCIKQKEPNLRLLSTAADRNRTGTGITTHGILSPGRLPVPPLRHFFAVHYILQNGTYRARTYDPLLVRQMLSQLS